jgi:hypothetical protein
LFFTFSLVFSLFFSSFVFDNCVVSSFRFHHFSFITVFTSENWIQYQQKKKEKKMASSPQFSCVPCSKSFSSDVDLQNHLKGGKHKKVLANSGCLALTDPVKVPEKLVSSALVSSLLPAVRKSDEAFGTNIHPCLPDEDKSCFICDKVFISRADFGVHVASSAHVFAASVFRKAYDMGFHRGLEYAGVSLNKRVELTSDPQFEYGGLSLFGAYMSNHMTARCLMMTITLTRMISTMTTAPKTMKCYLMTSNPGNKVALEKDYEEVGAESADADAEGGHVIFSAFFPLCCYCACIF